MKRDLIPHATLDGRHTGALLAHPHHCGNPRCTTLGEHLWDATRNMAPGLPAQAYEPRTTTSSSHRDSDPPPDPTGELHTHYRRLLDNYRTAALDLTRFIDLHRPDRHIPLPDPGSDDDWCRNHLELVGTCEPRHRGDLCRRCYDIHNTHGQAPDRLLLQAIRDRGIVTPAALADFTARTRPTRRRRKKAG